MTQIVYDGDYLYADRKVYADGRVMNTTPKLKSVLHGDKILHYAFSGSIADTLVGEKVVESNFDPEVCKWALDRIGHENSQDNFLGIVVETHTDPSKNGTHNVYLVNHVGDKQQMMEGQFIVVGAYETMIRDVKRTIDKFCHNPVKTEEMLRFALAGTNQSQDGFVIDRVDLYWGTYEEV